MPAHQLQHYIAELTRDRHVQVSILYQAHVYNDHAHVRDTGTQLSEPCGAQAIATAPYKRALKRAGIQSFGAASSKAA